MKIISQPGIGALPPGKNLSGADNLFRGKQRVHRAGAEPFQIESHKLESKVFENTRKLSRHLWSHSANHLIARNFYTRNVTVVAHAKLAKSKPPERIFTLL